MINENTIKNQSGLFPPISSNTLKDAPFGNQQSTVRTVRKSEIILQQ